MLLPRSSSGPLTTTSPDPLLGAGTVPVTSDVSGMVSPKNVFSSGTAVATTIFSTSFTTVSTTVTFSPSITFSTTTVSTTFSPGTAFSTTTVSTTFSPGTTFSTITVSTTVSPPQPTAMRRPAMSAASSIKPFRFMHPSCGRCTKSAPLRAIRPAAPDTRGSRATHIRCLSSAAKGYVRVGRVSSGQGEAQQGSRARRGDTGQRLLGAGSRGACTQTRGQELRRIQFKRLAPASVRRFAPPAAEKTVVREIWRCRVQAS